MIQTHEPCAREIARLDSELAKAREDLHRVTVTRAPIVRVSGETIEVIIKLGVRLVMTPTEARQAIKELNDAIIEVQAAKIARAPR